MAKAKRAIRIIELKDYGDDWVNRLAQVEDAFREMHPRERDATLLWLNKKYSAGSVHA